VVVLPHPGGRRSFGVPHDFFPGEAAEGDVFEVSVERDARETRRQAEENRRLLEGLSGGGR
jgi:hypothetical protein